MQRHKSKVLLSSTALFAGIVSYGFTVYFFATLAFVLILSDPSSYSGVSEGQGFERLWEFFYFSGVTITTLGYGDIVPETWLSQLMTLIEIGLGLFYVLFIFGAFVSYRVSKLGLLSADRDF